MVTKKVFIAACTGASLCAAQSINIPGFVKNFADSCIFGTNIPNAGFVLDADGNVYQSVQIGNQVWMVENWKATKYNDGTPIPHVTDNDAWNGLTTGAYCSYGNIAANKDKFGALYNWHAVRSGKLAPAGWHVPTNVEWKELIKYLVLNGYKWGGTTDTTNLLSMNKVGKSLAAKKDWNTSTFAGMVGNDQSNNNATGFSALPGGWRRYEGGQDPFTKQASKAYWWSSVPEKDNKAWNYVLNHNSPSLKEASHYTQYGLSVRLLRDSPAGVYKKHYQPFARIDISQNRVHIKDEGRHSVRMFDLQGRLRCSWRGSGEKRYAYQGLEAGIYYLEVKSVHLDYTRKVTIL